MITCHGGGGQSFGAFLPKGLPWNWKGTPTTTSARASPAASWCSIRHAALLFLKQALDTMKHLYENGNTADRLDRLATLPEFQKATKVPEYEAWEYQYAK